MDPSSLRAVLSKTDHTPVTVQASSRAIMRHYDHSPTNAVNEWRNSIQTCATSQLLPLLYVANEVLQTSKRNRGNKFLEAFSPVLGTSTRFICERERSIVEKVRRVIKIWGDRRVFSQRYVGELLTGLDTFREQASPVPVRPAVTATKSVLKSKKEKTQSPIPDDDDSVGSDSSPFSSQGPSLLQVDVKVKKDQVSAFVAKKNATRKRPRDQFEKKSTIPAKKQSTTVSSQKFKVYSTSTLLDLLRRTESLSSEFNSAKSMVEGCPTSHFSTDPDSVADLVGDELVKMHDDVRNTGKLLLQQRKKIHAIAKERRSLEVDAVKFIPFLKDSLKQDDDELKFCDQIEEKINLLSAVIDFARSAREKRRQEEEEKRQKEYEQKRLKEEEAERKKLLETAIGAKVDLQGMIYNPATREYQHVHDHTEDDWRN